MALRDISAPVEAVNFKSFGTIVYPHLVPVNPAVFDREQNSIAHFLEPSIAKMLLGSEGSVMKHSYAES